jgi:GT2 family glycosyltransferase
MYDISCSIVLYENSSDDIRKAIESVIHCARNIKLILVDNSAKDQFRYEFNYPGVEYIFTGKNLGYGKAHNLAIEKIRNKSKYHLILNPDIEFNPSILDSLFRFMEKRLDIGLVMPKVLYRNGEHQHLCKMLPSPADLFIRRFVPGFIKSMFKRQMEFYEMKHRNYDDIMDIPNLSGCFMFVRTPVFSIVGTFDERYFLYLEDTDLCRRINEYYRTVYYPTVSIIHGYSKASYKSLRLMRHHILSSIKYFNKWGWLFDRKRNNINASIMNNLPIPILHPQKIRKIVISVPAGPQKVSERAGLLQPLSAGVLVGKLETDQIIA